MKYRDILDRVRVDVPVKHYDVEHLVDGDIPKALAERLPLFGSEDGEERYTSSGGRSIIVNENGKVYRIKGADPKGVITRTVASSTQNIIGDVRQSVSACPKPEEIERILVSGMNREFPPYKEDRPFNFLTKEATERSRQAFEKLGEGYEQAGFSHPCAFQGYVSYRKIRWNGQPVRSIIFQLPDAESDLREDEFSRRLQKHLQHASVEQLQQVRDKFVDFYTALLRWHAFDCRVLAENQLLPTEDSMIGQNYVMGHVSKSGIGIARVDHTSTQRTNLEESELEKKLQKFVGILVMSASYVPLALEMAERNTGYDRDRYSGYYDAALKFHFINYKDWPKNLEFMEKLRLEFRDAYSSGSPQPIDEAALVDLFEAVTSIKIDEEFEKRKERTYEEFKRELAKKGLTLEMVARRLVQK